VLVVDDDPIISESLAEFLREEGFDVTTAVGGKEAIDALQKAESGSGATEAPRPFAVVISDVSMPEVGGMDLLRHIAKSHPATVALLLTGYGTIESAVEALRHGAVDYLTKPVLDSELKVALQRALRQQMLLAENRQLKAQLETRYGLDSVIGSDERMLRTYDLVEAVAPTKTTVLMCGESGTGKSLIAHAIHLRSPRKDKPFVELACGSIPETLLESELFGHVKGSFTGAHADKIGKFLAANGGTLFLDEINSAPPAMQLKLLRVLQERKFEPVGSNTTIEVDVRVILATNQPLEELVAAGKFRQDLYYRVNVVKIDLPPLRERTSDVPHLVDHFLRQHAASVGRAISGVDPLAMDALRRYSFPGNVRELGNIIERAVVLTRTATIRLEDLPPQVTAGSGVLAANIAPIATGLSQPQTGAAVPVTGPLHASSHSSSPTGGADAASLQDAMKAPERQIILQAIRACNGNKLKAAEMLQINRTTLYKKMKVLGIDPKAA
jgi:DNA-binding NtrC family response regulator